jgi:hypothetical protein
LFKAAEEGVAHDLLQEEVTALKAHPGEFEKYMSSKAEVRP